MSTTIESDTLTDQEVVMIRAARGFVDHVSAPFEKAAGSFILVSTVGGPSGPKPGITVSWLPKDLAAVGFASVPISEEMRAAMTSPPPLGAFHVVLLQHGEVSFAAIDLSQVEPPPNEVVTNKERPSRPPSN